MIKNKTAVMDDAAHNANILHIVIVVCFYIHSGLGNTREFHNTVAAVVILALW